MTDIVVVSLFDGISGGRIALDRVPHLNVLRYYSSEIDKYAIAIANKNYPQDAPCRLGDITKLDGRALRKEIESKFGNTPILFIGGSPCTNFSFASGRKSVGMSTKERIKVTSLQKYRELIEEGFEFIGQSYLFWEYVRVKEELQPDLFMLENVKMAKKWEQVVIDAIGVPTTKIDSSLVSAQIRPRYYWHNFGALKPLADKGLTLKDIVVDDFPYNPRYETPELMVDKSVTPGIARAIVRYHDLVMSAPGPTYSLPMTNAYTRRQIGITKSPPLLTADKRVIIDPLRDDIVYCRDITVLERERLQTLPEGYTNATLNGKPISKTQRIRGIGNGWTIDVIAHILSHI